MIQEEVKDELKVYGISFVVLLILIGIYAILMRNWLGYWVL